MPGALPKPKMAPGITLWQRKRQVLSVAANQAHPVLKRHGTDDRGLPRAIARLRTRGGLPPAADVRRVVVALHAQPVGGIVASPDFPVPVASLTHLARPPGGRPGTGTGPGHGLSRTDGPESGPHQCTN